MWISKRALLTTLVMAAAAVSLALAASALGRGDHHGKARGNPLVEETLAPSQPTDPSFHGVAPGAAPWVIKQGDVEVRRGGRLDLHVKGLVIPVAPGNGTPGPVTTISASLFCGADSSTAAADTSQSVPISRSGNARIRDRSFNVPATCLAPVVLVHPNGDTAHYIAVDGWRF